MTHLRVVGYVRKVFMWVLHKQGHLNNATMFGCLYFDASKNKKPPFLKTIISWDKIKFLCNNVKCMISWGPKGNKPKIALQADLPKKLLCASSEY